MKTEKSLSFKDEFGRKASIIEDALKKYLPSEDETPDVIHKAVHYSVFGRGKRIRPVLSMAAFEMFDEDVRYILPVACALEYIHTYSLIHDDLPAMDNDDMRRGKPTSHKVFGEAIAILAGDALLTHAFNVIFDAAIENKERMHLYLTAGKTIAQACDMDGLIGGQAIDINSAQYVDSPEKLMDMDLKKTGRLITASVTAGAIIGGAGAEEISAVKAFGEKLGLAFQVRDDILDSKENDIAPKKPTYVSVLGVDGSEQYVRELSNEALGSLRLFRGKAAFLSELTKNLVDRKA